MDNKLSDFNKICEKRIDDLLIKYDENKEIIISLQGILFTFTIRQFIGDGKSIFSNMLDDRFKIDKYPKFDQNPYIFKYIHEYLCNGYITTKECNLPPFTSDKFKQLLKKQLDFFCIEMPNLF